MKNILNIENSISLKSLERYFAPKPKGKLKIIENKAECIKYNQEIQEVVEDARYRFAKSRQAASQFFFNA